MGFLGKSGGCFLAAGLCLLLGINGVVCANSKAAVGDWQTIDHKTNRPSSIIRIWKSRGRYFGKVAKIYPENGHKVTDRCVNCKGALHNKRNLGMTIMRDMLYRNGQYGGGKILDPRSGKYYHCVMTVVDQGRKLHLRGYIGIPLFGETDTWLRVPHHRLAS